MILIEWARQGDRAIGTTSLGATRRRIRMLLCQTSRSLDCVEADTALSTWEEGLGPLAGQELPLSRPNLPKERRYGPYTPQIIETSRATRSGTNQVGVRDFPTDDDLFPNTKSIGGLRIEVHFEFSSIGQLHRTPPQRSGVHRIYQPGGE